MSSEKVSLDISSISNWICNYATSYGKDTLLVPFDGSTNSAVVTWCCLQSTILKTGTLKVLSVVPNNEQELFKKIFNHSYAELPGSQLYYHSLELAKNSNGICVGCVDKTYGSLYRSYKKYNEYLADIQPLYDFLYSEIVEMSESLGFTKNIAPLDYRIYEWALQQESYYKIITSLDAPNKSYKWYTYTEEQRSFIAKMHQREKKTKHKEIKVPYFKK
jgi:hypothetical protein